MSGSGGEAGVRLEAEQRLAVVAHELRSPVAALSALAAAAAGVPAEQRPRLLALAIAAARDIERILVEPDVVALQTERVDLGELVSGLAGDRVEVAVSGRSQVDADPTRLRQALANLVDNGLRHGSRVVIEVWEGDGLVVVDVIDDGPGVDPVLDVFSRGVSAAGSSGLGLWVARSIAEAHGGTLELAPDDGPGARFRLSLPPASVVR